MSSNRSFIAKKHLKTLGLKRELTWEALQEHMASKFGVESLDDLDKMEEYAGSSLGYAIKNKNYDQALYLGGAFHGDILESICDWIYKNQHLFGDSILEVGCDTGVITSFLGKLFPEKKIVAIDRDPHAVEFSKKTCEKLGVGNVEFLCLDLMDMKETFDTVLLSRVVHECVDYSERQPLDEAFREAELCRKSLRNFCNTLREVVSEGGNVVSLDLMGTDSIYLGYIRAMGDAGFFGDSSTHQELVCKKFEYSVLIETMSFSRKKEDCDPEETFLKCFSHHASLHASHYSMWDAEIMVAYLSKDVLEGWEVIEGDKLVAHYALMTHNVDETCILKYFSLSCVQGNAYELEIYDLSEKELVAQNLREITSRQIAG